MNRFQTVRQRSRPILVTALCVLPMVGWAQLALVPDQEPQRVFAGQARKIKVLWRNASDKPADTDLRARLIQTTSATAVRLSEVPWKRLQVLPGQTILESSALDFPEVKAETSFLVQWISGTNTVLGSTEVLVSPTNLLAELKSLAGDDEPLGLFDPSNQLKPLLKSLRIEFTNLEDAGLESFRGKLAIVGPFASKGQVPDAATKRIQKLAENGAAVVWILPPPERRRHAERPKSITPSFCTVLEGKGAVVVAEAGLVAHLPESPNAQLNLIQLARLALRPEPLRLPDLKEHP